MGEDEKQTSKTEPKGTEDNKALAADGKPLSDYDKHLALVERREKVLKEEEELLEEKKKFESHTMLGGTSGGRVEPKMVSPEDKKIEGAKEFFKGTALGDDITKANKKDG